MLRGIVLSALLALGCISVSEANVLKWCMKSNTISYNATDLWGKLPFEECALNGKAGALAVAGVDDKLQKGTNCFNRLAHVACKMYGGTSQYFVEMGEDKCVLTHSDDSWDFVEINPHDHKPALTLNCQRLGEVTCNPFFDGIWVLRAHSTNAVNADEVRSKCPYPNACILIAQHDHQATVQSDFKKNDPNFFGETILYDETNPTVTYNSILKHKQLDGQVALKEIFFVVLPSTDPDLEFLKRLWELMSANDRQSINRWFENACSGKDYYSEQDCLAKITKIWKSFPDLTHKRCPRGEKNTIEELLKNFEGMFSWVQQASNLFSRCDDVSLNSNTSRKMLQGIGCSKDEPPSPDSVKCSIKCKQDQVWYAYWIMNVFMASVITAVVRVLKYAHMQVASYGTKQLEDSPTALRR